MRLATPLVTLALIACVRAAPASALKPMQLINAGFEDGAAHFDGWETACLTSRCSTPIAERVVSARTGRAAARLSGLAEEWSTSQLRQLVTLTGSPSVLQLGAWVRDGSGGTGPPVSADVRLAVEFDGRAPDVCETRSNWPGTEWVQIEARCTAPAGASRASVVVQVASVRSGAVLHVDDVQLDYEPLPPTEVGQRFPISPAGPARTGRVPRLVHFIFGLSANFGGKPFGLVHHLVVKAAIRSVEPSSTYFYYCHEPTGEWWKRTKPLLTLRHVAPPKSVFGHPLREGDFAHQVMRRAPFHRVMRRAPFHRVVGATSWAHPPW